MRVVTHERKSTISAAVNLGFVQIDEDPGMA